MSKDKEEQELEWRLNTPLSAIFSEVAHHTYNDIMGGYYGFMKDDENAAKYQNPKTKSKFKRMVFNYATGKTIDAPATVLINSMEKLSRPLPAPAVAALLGASSVAKAVVDKGNRYNETKDEAKANAIGGASGIMDAMGNIILRSAETTNPVLGYMYQTLLSVGQDELKEWMKREQDASIGK